MNKYKRSGKHAMKLVPGKRALLAIFIYVVIANIFVYYFIHSISSFDRAFSFPYEGNEIKYVRSWIIFTFILNIYVLIPVLLYEIVFVLMNIKKNRR